MSSNIVPLFADLVEEKSTSVQVGKGGVNVDAGKGKPGGGTHVSVGGKGNSVGVHTGKPGKRTNVGVGKGGLSVKTVHDIIVTMRSVAKYAEREYDLRNPMHNISMPKIEKKNIPVLNEIERKKR